jgi:hypothetical protein
MTIISCTPSVPIVVDLPGGHHSMGVLLALLERDFATCQAFRATAGTAVRVMSR